MRYMGTHNRTGRGAGGFSLMEVLAALAVLGGAVFVLLNAHFTALKLHEVMADEVNMRQLMEIAVAKAEVGVMSGMLSDGGDFGARYADYAWSYDAALAGSDEAILLYMVNASVTGPDDDRTLTFYVYDTGLGDQTEKDGKKDSKAGSSKQTSGSSGSSGTQARSRDRRGRSQSGSGSGMMNGSSRSRSGRSGRSSMFGN